MDNSKYFLDSNIFLRPIVKDDSQKVEECEVLFGKIKRGELKVSTSNLVLAEVAWVCKSVYGLKRQAIAEVLSKILAFPNIKIFDNFNPYSAVQFYQQYSIKFIDALIASNPQIQDKEMIVISYDVEFDKLKIARKEPKEVK